MTKKKAGQKPEVFMKSYGSSVEKTFQNGEEKSSKEQNWKLNYDNENEKANIQISKNIDGKKTKETLDLSVEELEDLFGTRPIDKPLSLRLREDFLDTHPHKFATHGVGAMPSLIVVHANDPINTYPNIEHEDYVIPPLSPMGDTITLLEPPSSTISTKSKKKKSSDEDDEDDFEDEDEDDFDDEDEDEDEENSRYIPTRTASFINPGIDMDMNENNTSTIDFENYVRSFSNRHTSSKIKNNNKTKKGGKIKARKLSTKHKTNKKHRNTKHTKYAKKQKTKNKKTKKQQTKN